VDNCVYMIIGEIPLITHQSVVWPRHSHVAVFKNLAIFTKICKTQYTVLLRSIRTSRVTPDFF
jgi:hypothetical protein